MKERSREVEQKIYEITRKNDEVPEFKYSTPLIFFVFI